VEDKMFVDGMKYHPSPFEKDKRTRLDDAEKVQVSDTTMLNKEI
jgi:hypothetical protein